MATNKTYYWKIKTAGFLGAGTDAKARLSLHGDRGNMSLAWLLPESTMTDRVLTEEETMLWGAEPDMYYWHPKPPLGDSPRAFARNTVTFGRFPSCPDIGNLLWGVLLSDGSGFSADWGVVSVRIREDFHTVWVAEPVGVVTGGVETRIAFRTEWESRLSPRIRAAAAQALLAADPQEWLRQRQAEVEDIRRTTGREVRDAVLPGAESSERVKVPDPAQAHKMSEEELNAYRKQGLTDAQILERDAKKGLPLSSNEGRPISSSIPNRGSDFEGFAFGSATPVKLADEDETVEV